MVARVCSCYVIYIAVQSALRKDNAPACHSHTSFLLSPFLLFILSEKNTNTATRRKPLWHSTRKTLPQSNENAPTRTATVLLSVSVPLCLSFFISLSFSLSLSLSRSHSCSSSLALLLLSFGKCPLRVTVFFVQDRACVRVCVQFRGASAPRSYNRAFYR